jgi:type I restriction enzyme R subunit
VDITEVMQKVDALLDQSVEGFEIVEPKGGWKQYDLSQLDFDELKKKYETGRKRTQIELLRNSISVQVNRMIQVNITRMDFREELQEIINEYNTPNVSLDEVFKKLVDLSQRLKDEEKRYIREGLGSEEELAVFDLLTKPDMSLTKDETKKVKAVARQLLETLKREKFVLDWRRRLQTRAAVQLTINEMLDQLPDRYAKELYRQKCDLVYQYVYDLETTAA